MKENYLKSLVKKWVNIFDIQATRNNLLITAKAQFSVGLFAQYIHIHNMK